jgi:lactate dehydrogenase-like 2-hydroxyacid dehydrogenase
MLRIVYPDARFSDQGDIERAMLGGRSDIEIRVFREQPEGPPAVPAAIFAECDALIVFHKLTIDDVFLDCVPRCRLIVRAGVGLNNIQLKACGARGIPVCNVPAYGTHEIADHTMSLLLTLVRGTAAYNDRLRANPIKGWRFEDIAPVRRISGSTLGIAGLGRIGTAVAERAVGFGMKIIHFGGKSHTGFECVNSLEELLARSDVLSLHLPLEQGTDGLIDARAVSMMKPGLILINTARGRLVDTIALHEGLRSGRIAAAGLDVLPAEPPDLSDPLISAWKAGEEWIRDRLVITPHAAFFSREGFADLRRSSMKTALAFLCHGKLQNCVNERELLQATAR